MKPETKAQKLLRKYDDDAWGIANQKRQKLLAKVNYWEKIMNYITDPE